MNTNCPHCGSDHNMAHGMGDSLLIIICMECSGWSVWDGTGPPYVPHLGERFRLLVEHGEAVERAQAFAREYKELNTP